jgi:hypothetical protein
MSQASSMTSSITNASRGEPARVGTWGRERWLFLAGLLAFAVALSLRRLGDFDLPWHLATGRFITELRGIPKLDPLSYTHDPLTYVEPLTDVPLYWLAAIGGATALQVAGGIVGAGIGLALLWQLRTLGPIAYVASALALAGTYSWLVVRPATLSFLLVTLVLGAIEAHRRCALSLRGRSILFGFPLGVLLWANAHGFATLGAGLFVCYALYRIACRMTRGHFGGLLPLEDAAAAWATLLSAALSLLASTLNVAGLRLRLGPNRFSSDTQSVFALSGNTEFAPSSLDFFLQLEPWGAIIGILALLSLFLGRNAARRRRLPNAYDIGCVVIGGIGLAWVVRTVPIAILVMTPVVARRFAALIPATAITRWGLAGCSWLVAGFALVHNDTSFGFGFEPAHFPERAVAYIARNEPQGRMWNFSPFGGYLAWRLYPRHLVFMDGRSDHAHKVSSVLRSSAAMRDAKEFVALTSEFDVQYVVMGAKDGEAFGVPLSQSAQWTMVEFDDVAAVYVRNDGPNAALAAQGYRSLRHLTALSELLRVAVTGGKVAPLLRDDGRLAMAQDPTSTRAAFIAACGELAMRDLAAFDVVLQRLVWLSPAHPAIGVLLQARAAIVSRQ